MAAAADLNSENLANLRVKDVINPTNKEWNLATVSHQIPVDLELGERLEMMMVLSWQALQNISTKMGAIWQKFGRSWMGSKLLSNWGSRNWKLSATPHLRSNFLEERSKLRGILRV